MIELTLRRIRTGDEGTFGELEMPNGVTVCTGELPWRDNRVDVSCVPRGTYRVDWCSSAKFGGMRYRLRDVPERGAILIHEGNMCGDVELGLKSDVQGCILLGMRHGHLAGQAAVIASQMGLGKFYDVMDGQPFMLTIVNDWDNGGEPNEDDNVEADYGDGNVLSDDGLRNDAAIASRLTAAHQSRRECC